MNRQLILGQPASMYMCTPVAVVSVLLLQAATLGALLQGCHISGTFCITFCHVFVTLSPQNGISQKFQTSKTSNAVLFLHMIMKEIAFPTVYITWSCVCSMTRKCMHTGTTQ